MSNHHQSLWGSSSDWPTIWPNTETSLKPHHRLNTNKRRTYRRNKIHSHTPQNEVFWKGFNLNPILIERVFFCCYLYILKLCSFSLLSRWWFMTGRGIALNTPKMAPSSSAQWSYPIATQCGRDKWQPLGCKASSCTLVWASHLVIMLCIHQEGLIASQNR